VEAAVVTLRASEGREGRLVAYLVGPAETRPEAAGLREHVAGSLPEYMAPAAYVWLDRFPLTATGKLDRLALPPPEDTRPAQAHRPPVTREEIELAAIWSEVLQLDRVGIGDNFFELGGHSLLAVQMIARATPIFGSELPLRSIFEAPTIAELLAWAQAHGVGQSSEEDLLAALARQIAGLSDDEVMEKLKELQGGDA